MSERSSPRPPFTVLRLILEFVLYLLMLVVYVLMAVYYGSWAVERVMHALGLA